MNKKQSSQTIRLLEKELLGLIHTARLLHSSIHDIDKLMRVTVRITTEMLEVEGCSVVVRDREKGQMTLYSVGNDEPSKLTSLVITESEGVVGQSTLSNSTRVINDVGKIQEGDAKGQILNGFHTRSMLCVPMMAENEVVGELELINKKKREGFSRHDVLLAESVASQIAVAIQNVQLTQKSLKAERRAAMGEAVSGVAHCVKNMLNGLHGGLYVVKSDIKRAGVDISETGFTLLERNIGRLTELVKDMLTAANDRKPELELTNINDLAGSVVDLFEQKAKELGINLILKPESNLKDIVLDPRGIYRCILNLVSNSLDACKEKPGSEIRVETAIQRQQLIIRVSDTGTGIEKSILKSIFKPFFTVKGIEGTGLGLSVTQKIIREHGGKVDVDSTIGQGTIFTIFLPTNLSTT